MSSERTKYNIVDLDINSSLDILSLIRQQSYFKFIEHSIYCSDNIACYIEESLLTSSNYFFGTYDKNKIVGMCQCIDKGDYIFLNHIVVSDYYKGQGIGKCLFDCFIHLGRYFNKPIKLNVDSRNLLAIEWYKRLGMTTDSKTEFTIFNTYRECLNMNFNFKVNDNKSFEKFGFSHFTYEDTEFGLICNKVVNLVNGKSEMIDKISRHLAYPTMILPFGSRPKHYLGKGIFSDLNIFTMSK
ncbi:GNAT family N-acetyltransferase [Vibrio campbellii]|uniref:GNAT family N-acetyltransferase n=1 Tax=Vibrio campbellii TaxID=680 RepID=UPI00215BD003|nr:GNAT family N-acetyltransferase [Vibrio campbellii]MCR9908100.1 GNAT family N-acetyltransferase [Vibrio campbellii]